MASSSTSLSSPPAGVSARSVGDETGEYDFIASVCPPVPTATRGSYVGHVPESSGTTPTGASNADAGPPSSSADESQDAAGGSSSSSSEKVAPLAPPSLVRKKTAGERIKRGLAGAAKKTAGRIHLRDRLRALNLPKRIDEMERDQNLADDLERMNEATREERERLEMVREAEEACRAAMREHLADFRGRRGRTATYESWVASLHPENAWSRAVPPELLERARLADLAEAGTTIAEEDLDEEAESEALRKASEREIDHRFYVDESDHRRMWNASLEEGRTDERYVCPRTTARGSVIVSQTKEPTPSPSASAGVNSAAQEGTS